jgi:hypothetical protein
VLLWTGCRSGKLDDDEWLAQGLHQMFLLQAKGIHDLTPTCASSCMWMRH